MVWDRGVANLALIPSELVRPQLLQLSGTCGRTYSGSVAGGLLVIRDMFGIVKFEQLLCFSVSLFAVFLQVLLGIP